MSQSVSMEEFEALLNESFELESRDYLEIDKRTFHRAYAENAAFLIEIELPNQTLDLL